MQTTIMHNTYVISECSAVASHVNTVQVNWWIILKNNLKIYIKCINLKINVSNKDKKAFLPLDYVLNEVRFVYCSSMIWYQKIKIIQNVSKIVSFNVIIASTTEKKYWCLFQHIFHEVRSRKYLIHCYWQTNFYEKFKQNHFVTSLTSMKNAVTSLHPPFFFLFTGNNCFKNMAWNYMLDITFVYRIRKKKSAS